MRYAPRTKLIDDHFPEISCTNDDMPNSLMAKQLQLMCEKGFTCDGHQYFRKFAGQIAKPCAKATCKDRNADIRQY